MSGPVPAARVIAYYLPQFHPIPENDDWWGPGFTEWTNVARARPLFPGHFQPRIPGELGFYDLRLGEVREAQAQLARAHGIEGFCYWHYWFGGRLLLERPLEEVVASGEPDFPFCVGWANQTWTGIWHGAPGRVLAEQTYPGPEDDARHFDYLLPMFEDRRYLRVDGRPLLLVLMPSELPEPKRWADRWRELAQRAGLPGIHLVGHHRDDVPPGRFGFDAATWTYQGWLIRHGGDHLARRLRRLRGQPPLVFPFARAVQHMWGPAHPVPQPGDEHYPGILSGWDNTPRSGRRGLVLHGMTPELFREHVRNVLRHVAHKRPEERIVFLKSWNEWAEGNTVEPDAVWGRALLEVLRDELLGPA
jgi:hypothetical protein